MRQGDGHCSTHTGGVGLGRGDGRGQLSFFSPHLASPPQHPASVLPWTAALLRNRDHSLTFQLPPTSPCFFSLSLSLPPALPWTAALQRVLAAADRDHGLTFQLGFEMEFYLFRRPDPTKQQEGLPPPIDASNYSSCTAFDAAAPGQASGWLPLFSRFLVPLSAFIAAAPGEERVGNCRPPWAVAPNGACGLAATPQAGGWCAADTSQCCCSCGLPWARCAAASPPSATAACLPPPPLQLLSVCLHTYTAAVLGEMCSALASLGVRVEQLHAESGACDVVLVCDVKFWGQRWSVRLPALPWGGLLRSARCSSCMQRQVCGRAGGFVGGRCA